MKSKQKPVMSISIKASLHTKTSSRLNVEAKMATGDQN